MLRRLAAALPVLLGALAASAVAAEAQGVSAHTISIRVDVLGGLSVGRERDLLFGSRVAGSGVHTVPLTSAQAGLFRILGANNAWVTVTLSPPAVLDNGMHTVPYTWQAASHNAAADPATATVRTTTTFQVRQQGAVPGNHNQSWVWVYGSIDTGTTPAALSPGTYTGVFGITVVY